VIDEVMAREEALALLDCADCYASLHRSEGLGLGLAESMLLGKPVIATGYSGNLDFMSPDAAHLVESRRVPIVEDLSPYPKGCHWAEPSVEHAAALMRQVYDRPDEARALGNRAKAHAERVLSVEAAGRRMADRLRAIETPFRSPTRGAA
jgi:glycosyltransferase involved in cell wall biosynthesis